MTVAETSIQAYADLKDSGTLGRQQTLILAAIIPGGRYTRSELADITGLPINVVTGRVNELVKAGRLDDGAPRQCRITKHTAKTVRRPEVDGA
jgi:DNA-binding MarR family transcriptional regulator